MSVCCSVAVPQPACSPGAALVCVDAVMQTQYKMETVHRKTQQVDQRPRGKTFQMRHSAQKWYLASAKVGVALCLPRLHPRLPGAHLIMRLCRRSRCHGPHSVWIIRPGRSPNGHPSGLYTTPARAPASAQPNGVVNILKPFAARPHTAEHTPLLSQDVLSRKLSASAPWRRSRAAASPSSYRGRCAARPRVAALTRCHCMYRERRVLLGRLAVCLTSPHAVALHDSSLLNSECHAAL